MEQLKIKINQPDDFDAALKHSLPEHGDLELITKHGGMVSGAAIAMLTFTVRTPDGQDHRVQATTSVKLLRTTVGMLIGAYDDNGFPVEGVGGASAFEDDVIEEKSDAD